MHGHRFQLRLGSRRERLRKGGLVLIFYPLFALVALFNLNFGPPPASLPARAIFWSLHGGWLLYAPVYLLSSAGSRWLRRRGRRVAAFHASAVPLAYAGALCAIGAAYLALAGD